MSNANERIFRDFFCDPYDISTSFQLSGRLKGNDQFRWLNCIRDIDAALTNRRYREVLRLVQIATSFLTPDQRRKIISRLVYNDLYLRSFGPKIFSLPLIKQEGRFMLGWQPSVHLELGINLHSIQKTMVRESRRNFHALYGRDFSSSSLAVRYSKVADTGAQVLAHSDRGSESTAFFKDTNTNFLHLDEKKGITTILYLSDVAVPNGAFRYVEGSHEAKISPTLKAIHEFVYNDLKIATYDGVMCFPPEFRAGINYYFWLEPEKQRIIDSFTKTLIGPAGTAITFAGNRLLHGGGIPYLGERSALFIQHIGRFSHRLRHLLHPVSVLRRAGYGDGQVEQSAHAVTVERN